MSAHWLGNKVPEKMARVAGLDELPNAPGVYLFFGEGSVRSLPLYIGKSVALRTRVLSHFREPAELRMMAQVRRVEHVRTAGEVGALLLESHLIKARQPLYNQRLRRTRDLCSWQLADDALRPVLVFSRDVAFAHAQDLYGLFVSVRRAHDFLLALAQAQRLCLATLGLEAAGHRGCFGLQIGRCAGACVGRESTTAHAERLRQAFRAEAVQRWPFEGPVGLVERDGDWAQTHVVDGWRHLRTEDSRGVAKTSGLASEPGFDLDAYRILVRPLLAGDAQLVHLSP